MDNLILKLKSVTFGYQSGESLLEDIALEVRRGEYIGIVGANGSAKSTLLRLMVGILKPKCGKIYIKNVEIEKFKEWGSIGYLSQQVRSFNTNFPATVEEVIGANLYSQKGILKILNKNDKEKIKDVLKRVGMEDYGSRLIGSLSGGQQQRIFIARLLISRPDIIFMDEPLVGMDLNSRAQFYDILDDLNKNMGITLVMVSHDIKEIFEKSDRVLLLKNRKILEHSLIDCKTKAERLEIAEKDMKNLI